MTDQSVRAFASLTLSCLISPFHFTIHLRWQCTRTRRWCYWKVMQHAMLSLFNKRFLNSIQPNARITCWPICRSLASFACVSLVLALASCSKQTSIVNQDNWHILLQLSWRVVCEAMVLYHRNLVVAFLSPHARLSTEDRVPSSCWWSHLLYRVGSCFRCRQWICSHIL